MGSKQLSVATQPKHQKPSRRKKLIGAKKAHAEPRNILCQELMDIAEEHQATEAQGRGARAS